MQEKVSPLWAFKKRIFPSHRQLAQRVCLLPCHTHARSLTSIFKEEILCVKNDVYAEMEKSLKSLNLWEKTFFSFVNAWATKEIRENVSPPFTHKPRFLKIRTSLPNSIRDGQETRRDLKCYNTSIMSNKVHTLNHQKLCLVSSQTAGPTNHHKKNKKNNGKLSGTIFLHCRQKCVLRNSCCKYSFNILSHKNSQREMEKKTRSEGRKKRESPKKPRNRRILFSTIC